MTVNRNQFLRMFLFIFLIISYTFLFVEMEFEGSGVQVMQEKYKTPPLEYSDYLEKYLKPTYSSSALYNIEYDHLYGSSFLDLQYQDRYNASPPLKFDKWLDLATDLKCSLRFEYYDQIIRDVSPFKNLSLFQRKKILSNLPSEWLGNDVHFDNGLFYPNLSSFYPALFSDPRYSRWTENVFGHDPLNQVLTKTWTFRVSETDEPKIVFSKTPYSGRIGVELIDNECARQVYNDSKNDAFLHASAYYKEGVFFSAPGERLVLSQSKGLCYNDVLVPMGYHYNIAKSSKSWKKEEKKFDEKVPALFWRGSTTGGALKNDTQWRRYGRIKLLDWEKEYRKKYPRAVFTAGQDVPPLVSDTVPVDIGLSSTLQCDPEVCQEIEKEYGTKPFVKKMETINFKYLLVVDGNAWPSRMQEYLQYQSVILYPRSSFDWYLWYLKPFVHYVPINIDYSDLEEKLNWLHQNPDWAKYIIQNANQVSKIINRVEQLQCHTYFALMHLEEYLLL